MSSTYLTCQSQFRNLEKHKQIFGDTFPLFVPENCSHRCGPAGWEHLAFSCPLPSSAAASTAMDCQEERGGGVLPAHLQGICCSRQQPPVLKAKYHPGRNNIYCRRQKGWNTRWDTFHAPSSAVNTQECIPEPLYRKTLKSAFFSPDICIVGTGLRFRNVFPVIPQSSSRGCRGSQPQLVPSQGDRQALPTSAPAWAEPWSSRMCQPDAATVISVTSKAQSSPGSCLHSTADALQFTAGLAQRKDQKAELIRALGLPLVIPAQHIEKQQSGTIAPSHLTKAKAVQGEMQMGFHHSQLCQKLCSLAWLLRALQAVSLSLHTSSVLAPRHFWTPCPQQSFKILLWIKSKGVVQYHH